MAKRPRPSTRPKRPPRPRPRRTRTTDRRTRSGRTGPTTPTPIPARSGPSRSRARTPAPAARRRRGPARSLRPAAMNHFEPRGGALFCEDVRSGGHRRGGGHAGLCLFLGDAGAALPGVPRRAARRIPALGEPLIAYAVKANSNVSVLRTLGAAGRRRRHRLGGRDPPRPGRRRAAPTGSSSPAWARPPQELAFALEGRRASDQCRVRAGAGLLVRALAAEQGVRAGAGPSGSIPTSAPAATPRSPPARRRASSASRWTRRRGSMPWPRAIRPCGRWAWPATSAARSPIWRPWPQPSARCAVWWRACAPRV